jgi:WD40 repeat protein
MNTFSVSAFVLLVCCLGANLSAEDAPVLRPYSELTAVGATDGAEGPPLDIEFSPDGKTLAAAAGYIRIWNVKTGKLTSVLKQWDGMLTGISFLPMGRRLLSSSGTGVVRIWDITEKTDPETVLVNARGVVGFALSPDGSTIAVNYAESPPSKEDDLHLWDLKAGKSKFLLERSSKGSSWRFSHDGAVLAAVYEGGIIKFWDTASGKVKETAKPWPEASGISRIEYSPDGQLMAIMSGESADRSTNHQLGIWNIKKNRIQATISGTEEFSDYQFSPDGRLLAAGQGKQITVWDATTGGIKYTLNGSSKHIRTIAFSPNGKVLAGGKMTQPKVTNEIGVLLWEFPERSH